MTVCPPQLGNFRVLLSILTALGGLVALLLLAIPPGRDIARYPDTLHWGVGCGKPDNRARFGFAIELKRQYK